MMMDGFVLNLLISATLSKVDHGLSELFFTNTAVVVEVEHAEGGPHIVHLGERLISIGVDRD